MNQIEIRILAAHKAPITVAEHLIERCRSEYDAFLLCWHKRQVPYSQSTAADLLGIQHSHFSNILSGKKRPPCVETPLERENRLLKERVEQLERAA